MRKKEKKNESSHNKGILNASIISRVRLASANRTTQTSEFTTNLNLKTPAPAQNDG